MRAESDRTGRGLGCGRACVRLEHDNPALKPRDRRVAQLARRTCDAAASSDVDVGEDAVDRKPCAAPPETQSQVSPAHATTPSAGWHVDLGGPGEEKRTAESAERRGQIAEGRRSEK